MPIVEIPSIDSIRPLISLAALLVNVTASRECGDTPSARISQAIRWTSTRVLPEPAPARTKRLPLSAATASRWASLRSERMSETSMPEVYRNCKSSNLIYIKTVGQAVNQTGMRCPIIDWTTVPNLSITTRISIKTLAYGRYCGDVDDQRSTPAPTRA